MRKILVLTLLLFFISHTGSALKTDSLRRVWLDTSLPDTNRLNAMDEIAWDGYVFSNPDSAFYFAQQQYDLALKRDNQYHLAKALNTQGVSLWIKGSYDYAIYFHEQSLKIREKIKHRKGIATSLGNLGLVYSDMGNYGKAMDYYQRSLSLSEEIGFTRGKANALDNIGIVLSEQGNFAAAVEHYTKSLQLKEEIGDKKGAANSLNNIGVLYLKQKDYEKAIEYYSKSLAIREGTGDERGIALSYNNLGLVFNDKKDYEKAMDYYKRSMEIYEKLGDQKGISQASNNIGILLQKLGKADDAFDNYAKSLKISDIIGDKRGMTIALINIGKLLYEQGEFKTAVEFTTDALDLTEELAAIREAETASNILYECYKQLEQTEDALRMHELLMMLRDSINNEENQRAVIKQEYKYKYEKEALADSLKAAEENKLTQERLKRQEAELKSEQTRRYALYGGILVLLLFGIYTYQRFQKSRKQNKIIEHQKKQVEEAHKEITDSISYAKRIQQAILPPMSQLEENFENIFVFYRPKDVVAGDFYWMEMKDNLTLLAVADCTGHGVPGALVSVVCHNALNRSVHDYNLSDPGKILDRTRDIVVQEFKKSSEEVADGMDISLIALEQDTLWFAGANNPLWIVRDGKIIEFKGDKQPVGKYITSLPFNTTKVNLVKGDTIYLFTDGLADQFGGPKGKKFKYKAFKEMLIELQSRGMNDQKSAIEACFDKWKGKENQVDDVCVVGFRV